jgi:hypothetical protein
LTSSVKACSRKAHSPNPCLVWRRCADSASRITTLRGGNWEPWGPGAAGPARARWGTSLSQPLLGQGQGGSPGTGGGVIAWSQARPRAARSAQELPADRCTVTTRAVVARRRPGRTPAAVWVPSSERGGRAGRGSASRRGGRRRGRRRPARSGPSARAWRGGAARGRAADGPAGTGSRGSLRAVRPQRNMVRDGHSVRALAESAAGTCPLSIWSAAPRRSVARVGAGGCGSTVGSVRERR